MAVALDRSLSSPIAGVVPLAVKLHHQYLRAALRPDICNRWQTEPGMPVQQVVNVSLSFSPLGQVHCFSGMEGTMPWCGVGSRSVCELSRHRMQPIYGSGLQVSNLGQVRTLQHCRYHCRRFIVMSF
jgi:hypothetical protein